MSGRGEEDVCQGSPSVKERKGRLGKLFWKQDEELAEVLIFEVRETVGIRDS